MSDTGLGVFERYTAQAEEAATMMRQILVAVENLGRKIEQQKEEATEAPPPNIRKYLTIAQAAERAHRKPATILNWEKERNLKLVRPRGQKRGAKLVVEDYFDAFLANMGNEKHSPEVIRERAAQIIEDINAKEQQQERYGK